MTGVDVHFQVSPHISMGVSNSQPKGSGNLPIWS